MFTVFTGHMFTVLTGHMFTVLTGHVYGGVKPDITSRESFANGISDHDNLSKPASRDYLSNTKRLGGSFRSIDG
jgi:hypothetical protein